MESASEEVRTALVCDAFGEFKAQEKAAVVFTTGIDVSSCKTSTVYETYQMCFRPWMSVQLWLTLGEEHSRRH